MIQKQANISRGKWEITLRNLRAMYKRIAYLEKRIYNVEKKICKIDKKNG